jgi:hypothetical protein
MTPVFTSVGAAAARVVCGRSLISAELIALPRDDADDDDDDDDDGDNNSSGGGGGGGGGKHSRRPASKKGKKRDGDANNENNDDDDDDDDESFSPPQDDYDALIDADDALATAMQTVFSVGSECSCNVYSSDLVCCSLCSASVLATIIC